MVERSNAQSRSLLRYRLLCWSKVSLIEPTLFPISPIQRCLQSSNWLRCRSAEVSKQVAMKRDSFTGTGKVLSYYGQQRESLTKRHNILRQTSACITNTWSLGPQLQTKSIWLYGPCMHVKLVMAGSRTCSGGSRSSTGFAVAQIKPNEVSRLSSSQGSWEGFLSRFLSTPSNLPPIV